LERADRRTRGPSLKRKRVDDIYFEPLEKVIQELENKHRIKFDDLDFSSFLGKRHRAELLVNLKERAGLRYTDVAELRTLQPIRQRFDDAKETMIRGIRDACLESRHRLQSSYAVLGASDPMAILARGFAVVRHRGHAVRDAGTLADGDSIAITFSRGGAEARIMEVKA